MNPWKRQFVALILAVLSISFAAFIVTGYTALYWAWIRGNLEASLSYLPWARNFGMLAMASAAAALGILFSSKTFPISHRLRLLLSVLATLTIGFFAEFRNEGKFHFKELVHFFEPGTWVQESLNRALPGLGGFLYRIEYSHWNDFLMGPAIVSILFSLAFLKLYGAFRDQGSISLNASTPDAPTELDDTLRFARTLMYVGLFWFFTQAWAEKAGYLSNPHSKDEIDLPVEFAGAIVGFWMARVLTKPFDERQEEFRSTFFIDILSSGVVGLLYTLIVGPLTEGVASAVAHASFSDVPGALNVHEYTPLQRHLRPLELLLLAIAMWWGLNRCSQNEELIGLGSTGEAPREEETSWRMPLILAKVFGATAVYLIIVVAMIQLLQPEGLVWTLTTAAAALGSATAALLLVTRTAQRGVTTVFGGDDKEANG